jgi:hypothetical protein
MTTNPLDSDSKLAITAAVARVLTSGPEDCATLTIQTEDTEFAIEYADFEDGRWYNFCADPPVDDVVAWADANGHTVDEKDRTYVLVETDACDLDVVTAEIESFLAALPAAVSVESKTKTVEPEGRLMGWLYYKVATA